MDQALLVAVLGLAVNGVSVFVLGVKGSDAGDHAHDEDQEHAHHQ